MVGADQPESPANSLWDPLVQIALRRSYVGVLNSYLQNQVGSLGCDEAVDGEVEQLEACPCCEYRSLQVRGEYEICRVCFWEDDGMTELDRASGPNHMTLREGRLNFRSFGAVVQSARSQVLVDGRQRYASAANECSVR